MCYYKNIGNYINSLVIYSFISVVQASEVWLNNWRRCLSLDLAASTCISHSTQASPKTLTETFKTTKTTSSTNNWRHTLHIIIAFPFLNCHLAFHSSVLHTPRTIRDGSDLLGRMFALFHSRGKSSMTWICLMWLRQKSCYVWNSGQNHTDHTKNNFMRMSNFI